MGKPMSLGLLKKIFRIVKRVSRTLIQSLKLLLLERRYRREYPTAARGATAWLVGTEIKYGGLVTGVQRNIVSPLDPRSKLQIATGGMKGGDRMLHNAYGKKYAQYLKPYLGRESLTLVEVGILKGTGLAIWCELFETGRIIGLDIDLGHIRSNMDDLKSRGAFAVNEAELYEFDQLMDNTKTLGDILSGSRIDIFIDDGLHFREAILNTMKSALPHLARDFTYFIEDNHIVHKEIRALYPDLLVDSAGGLTVVTRGQR
jgi:hypothetical protein